MSKTRSELFEDGRARMIKFCTHNNINMPDIVQLTPKDRYYHLHSCAFYRPYSDDRIYAPTIWIMIDKCAHIGNGVYREWSYPGYVVDRTPFGVLQHELGHHFEHVFKTAALRFRDLDEPKLTGYNTNWHENLAEHFRLYVTNPALLKVIRYRSYRLFKEFCEPVEHRSWARVLIDAPSQYHAAVQKRIEKENKRRDK